MTRGTIYPSAVDGISRYQTPNPVQQPQGQPPPPHATAPREPAPGNRTPWIIGGAALLVIVAAVILGIMLVGGDDDEGEDDENTSSQISGWQNFDGVAFDLEYPEGWYAAAEEGFATIASTRRLRAVAVTDDTDVINLNNDEAVVLVLSGAAFDGDPDEVLLDMLAAEDPGYRDYEPLNRNDIEGRPAARARFSTTGEQPAEGGAGYVLAVEVEGRLYTMLGVAHPDMIDTLEEAMVHMAGTLEAH